MLKTENDATMPDSYEIWESKPVVCTSRYRNIVQTSMQSTSRTEGEDCARIKPVKLPPSQVIYYRPFVGDASVVVIVRPLSVCPWPFVHFVNYSLVASCWERAVLLAFRVHCFTLYRLICLYSFSRLVSGAGYGIRFIYLNGVADLFLLGVWISNSNFLTEIVL